MFERLYIEQLKSTIEHLGEELIKAHQEKHRLMDIAESALKNTNSVGSQQINPFNHQTTSIDMQPFGGIELPSEKRRRLTMEAYERMRNAKAKDSTLEDMKSGRLDDSAVEVEN